ncbi:MAG: hypothetical protein GXP38_12735, partial [Chloroflexi bacterium]|nr:hypothetical protein [Chloroflexota bacterium]
MAITEFLTHRGHSLQKLGQEHRGICPLCEAGSTSKKRPFSTNGEVWKCFACDTGGNLYQLKKALGDESPTRSHNFRKKRKKARARTRYHQFDLGEAVDIIAGSPARDSKLRRWAQDRGWPALTAEALPGLSEALSWVPPTLQTHNWHCQTLLENTRDRPLLFHVRDQNGELVSYVKRATGEVEGPKAKLAPNDLVGMTPVKVFGHIPRALEAARRGETLRIVEGGPDALILMTKYGDTVLGAISAGDMPRLAKTLVKALRKAKLTPRIIVYPDMDITKENAVGELKARRCAEILARAAWVGFAKVPVWENGQGDVEDLIVRKGFDAFEALEVEDIAASKGSLKLNRAKLHTELRAGIKKGGTITLRAFTGLGKSHGCLEILLGPLLPLIEQGGYTVVYAVPTTTLRDEFAAKAREMLGRMAPTSTLRIEALKGRELGNCIVPTQASAMARAYPGGGKLKCGECPERGRCHYIKQFQDDHKVGRLIFKTHAMAYGHESWDPNTGELGLRQDTADILILDESTVDQWMSTVEVSTDHLLQLKVHGDIEVEDSAFAKLITAMATAATDKRGVGGSQRGTVESTLADLVGKNDFRAVAHTTTCSWDPNLLVGTPAGYRTAKAIVASRDIAKIKAAPDWRAATAMEQLFRRGGDGGSITKDGILICPAVKPIPKGTHATVFLDATTSKGLADIVAPEGAWLDYRQPLPPSTQIIRHHIDETPRGLMHYPNEPKRGEVTRERSAQIRHFYDSDKTLHITWKALLEDLEKNPQFKQAKDGHENGLMGPVIYHKSSESRGSNEYEDCHTIVISDFFVPKMATVALAQRLQNESPQMPWDEALELTKGHMETAQLLQEIGRVRPWSGKPVKIVLLMKRELEGFEPTTVYRDNVQEMVIAELSEA